MAEDVLHNRSVISLLEKLGLSRNAVKCYLALLTIGTVTVSDMAKAAHVNRVNAYGALKQLAERGLVEQEITKTGRRVHPVPLEHLQALAQDYQKHATRVRWKIEDLIPALLASTGKSENTPAFEGVSVFRGDEGFEKIAERSLTVPAGSVNYYIATEDFFHPESNPSYDESYYIPARMKYGIQSRSLSGRNSHGQRLHTYDAKEMRQTRFLPSHMKFPCAIFMYGDEVAFLWKRGETVGVAIKGSPIVQVMRMVFEMAWERAGKGTQGNQVSR